MVEDVAKATWRSSACTATSARVYREHAPAPHLAPYAVCTWTAQARSENGPQQHRVLPDGCADIIWFADAPPIVVGPMTRAALSTTGAEATLVGIRFRPGVAAAVLGVDLHELVDRHIPLDALWDRRVVAAASARLWDQPGVAGRIAIAESLVMSRRDLIAAPDPLVQQAVSILTVDRLVWVEGLARRLRVSERQLRRRFMRAVGYSPKAFQRIVRFQKVLALASANPRARLSELAHAAGYADQAHMTRDVGEFAGVTPSVLLGTVDSALALSGLLGECSLAQQQSRQ